MTGYRYRIIVEPIENAKGELIPETPLTFEAVNHDELLSLVARIQQRSSLNTDDTACLMIGLKLFSEVVLQHKQKPLFAPMLPHLREFISRLKAPDAFSD